MEYLTAAQIIADPEMSSEEKIRKLREMEGQPQPDPERVLQTLDRPNSILSGPGYGVAAPMLSQPEVPPGGGVGTRMPDTDLTTDESESFRRIMQRWDEGKTIPGYDAGLDKYPSWEAAYLTNKVAGGNKYAEWEAANKEPDVRLPMDLARGRVGPEKTQEQLREEYFARKLREISEAGPVEKTNIEWVSAYNDILTDPRISLAEKTRILDEYRGKSESDVKLRTLGKPVGNIQAFEGDPLGNPYPGYVETDEGLEQGPRPGTARRFVRLPTERKLETLDRPGSKLSGYPQRLDMRYLATDTPEVSSPGWGGSAKNAGSPTYGTLAEAGTATQGNYPAGGSTTTDVPAPAPEEPDVSPYATDADRKAADDKANEDAKAYLEEQIKELKSAIAKEKDPEKKKQLQEDLRTLEGEIAKAKKYVPQAAANRARAATPKKPEEPKPWFTEDNAPDTVFDGTDPLSGLVPATTQMKGNVYPSHLEWETPVPYTESTPDAKEAADIDSKIEKLQSQIGAEERKAAAARAAEEEKNGAVKSFKVAIGYLEKYKEQINEDVASGKISQAEGKLRIDETNLRISNLQNLIKNELDKKVPPSQIVQDLNKEKIKLLARRKELVVTGNDVKDFINGLADQLDQSPEDIRTKLLTNDGIQSKDKDGFIKFNLRQNPETGELELVKSKAKYRTAPQMQRDALDATVSAGRFKIPFEREANIEIQENVQKRQADLEKKIVEIQLAGAKLNKRQVDPQRWMRNASLGNKVGAMMYMVCMGMLNGAEGIKAASDDINGLIEQDIELQLSSITKDKEYVDFLKEDIGRIDKMFEGREKQIAAKHIIALEKAIQAAKMIPGADPAMVDYLEAELRTKQANEIKTIDEADKKEAYFGWAAPAAPKYGGGGGAAKKEKKDYGQTPVLFPERGISIPIAELKEAGWYDPQFSSSQGQKSPYNFYESGGELLRIAGQLRAAQAEGKGPMDSLVQSLLGQAVSAAMAGASNDDATRSETLVGAIDTWRGGIKTWAEVADTISTMEQLGYSYKQKAYKWLDGFNWQSAEPLDNKPKTETQAK